jgi:hypothetical protein
MPFLSKTSEEPEAPPNSILAGRIFPALHKYSGGMQFDFHDPGKKAGNRTATAATLVDQEDPDDVIEALFKTLNDLWEDDKEIFSFYESEWMPELETFWAKQARHTYLKLSPDIMKHLCRIYNHSVGYANKNIRAIAEQAHSELCEIVL